MGVLDGQAVSAAITNPAFINKNQDDTMSNKLTFNRALSGSTIADIQAAANTLYTCTGASESATGTVYDAPAGTITNGDSHETALATLANKFDAATGHTHTGAAGDAPPISSSAIIGAPLVAFFNAGTTLTGVTGHTYDVDSLLSGKTASTGSTGLGVIVTPPFNRVFLAATGTDCFLDDTGDLVYGRLTAVSGAFLLSFYSLIAGSETDYTFVSATDMNWYYRELYDPLVSTPVYDYRYPEFEFKNVRSLAVTGNSPIYGDIYFAPSGSTTLSQSGNVIYISASGGSGNNTTIAASGYSPLTGDVVLVPGTGVDITQSGQNITISATGSGNTTDPLMTTYTSGSGTHNTTNSPLYLRVQMVGPGGGGAGSFATANGGSQATGGGAGTVTTFGTSLLSASGGTGGNLANNGGSGGAGSISSPAYGIAISGADGQGTTQNSGGANFLAGGIGGSSFYGGAGPSNGNSAGSNGVANSGGGGGGAGTPQSDGYNGSGGGAGAYIDAIIPSPSSSYSYSVGTGGAAGSAATTNSFAGGTGADGIIIVTEYYG